LIWFGLSLFAGRRLGRRAATDRGDPCTAFLERVEQTLHFDYTTVGHVTIDVLADGTRRAGGAAFYSALQAARLGRRALIVTQGVASEIEALLEPFRDELALRVIPAPATTTLATTGAGATRSQRVLAWAGPIADGLELDTAILHLAPVAREVPRRWSGRSAFVGLTPQGLARDWSGLGDEFVPRPPPAAALELATATNGVVLSESEHASCTDLIAAAIAGGATVAITDGERPCTLMAGDATTRVEVPPLEPPHDDLGAGDVFAAALFVSLAAGEAAEDAARFAMAAAAVRMSAAGSGGVGERSAIERRLAWAQATRDPSA